MTDAVKPCTITVYYAGGEAVSYSNVTNLKVSDNGTLTFHGTREVAGHTGEWTIPPGYRSYVVHDKDKKEEED